MSDFFPSKQKMPGALRVWQAVLRIPYTLWMVVLLLLVAWWTQSYFQGLAREWVNQLGFAPRDFWFLRWERLILSAFATSGGSVFWFALAMVASTSGWIEWTTSSWKAALTFWGIHLATLVLESLLFLLPLHQLGFPQARALFFSRDVGPSAGYMASLGFVTTYLPKPWRWMAFGGVLCFLIISLFLPPRAGETQAVKLAADMAHLIAFPLGWLLAYTIGNNRKSVDEGGIMSEKSIAERLFIRPGNKLLLINPPEGYELKLGALPKGVLLLNSSDQPVEVIQFFVANRAELEAQLPRLKKLLTPRGMLWVTYHKGTSKVKTDINRDTINAYAFSIGLTGVAMISIDEDWSALRLKLSE